MRVKIIFSVILLCFSKVSLLGENLAEEATNQISRIRQLQLENDYSPTNYNARGTANTFIIRPINQFDANSLIPYSQLVRIKFPLFVTYPYSRTSFASYSTGDMQIFDLLVLHEDQKLRVGFGGIAILPTATKVQAGQGKWQAGPAFGFTYSGIPKWQFSLLAQNPISFAGLSDQPSQFTLLFKPAIVRHFARNWYVTSDAEWTLYWSTKQFQIPVNLGVGKIITLKKSQQKINVCVEAEWMAYHRTPLVVPKFTMQFCLSFLFE